MSVNVPQLVTRRQIDMVAEAKAARLVYVSDEMPGIQRIRRGEGFEYVDEGGERVDDAKVLQRIEELVIPPAWEDVWICPRPRGHLQATGRDAAGRKQYIYHDRWEEHRAQSRARNIVEFAHRLPALREAIDVDLRQHHPTLTRGSALACAILDRTWMRVGQEVYARENGTYGLTTLNKNHVDVGATRVMMRFIGKSGLEREVGFTDRRLASHLRRVMELPGERLMQFRDDEEEVSALTAADVNDYIHARIGDSFSAKDFRTWGACVAYVEAVLREDPPCGDSECHKRVVAAVKETALRLGNTPAVCRGHYIHTSLLDLAESVDAWSDLREAASACLDLEGRARLEAVLGRLLE